MAAGLQVALKTVQNLGLGFCVQPFGRFVEDQPRGIEQIRARQSKPSALAARQSVAVLGQRSLQAVRKRPNPVGQTRVGQGAPKVII